MSYQQVASISHQRVHLTNMGSASSKNKKAIVSVKATSAAPLLVVPKTANEMIKEKKYQYVDVRTKKEFEDVGHHKEAVNVEFFSSMGPPPVLNSDFLSSILKKFPEKDCPILVGCAAGGRSAKASQLLVENGYTNVADLKGGFKAWAEEFGDQITFGCGC
jgi:rhodanese-related sulfurtransferase